MAQVRKESGVRVLNAKISLFDDDTRDVHNLFSVFRHKNVLKYVIESCLPRLSGGIICKHGSNATENF